MALPLLSAKPAALVRLCSAMPLYDPAAMQGPRQQGFECLTVRLCPRRLRSRYLHRGESSGASSV